MALITRRIMLCGLMLLVSACVHPHHFYHGGHGDGHYRDGGGDRHRGGGHRERSHH